MLIFAVGMKDIKVSTRPNGYELKIDSREYFYFSEYDLIEGMLYHIMADEKGYSSKEDIKDVLTACMTYGDRKDVIHKIVLHERTIARMQEQAKRQQDRINMLRNKLERIGRTKKGYKDIDDIDDDED